MRLEFEWKLTLFTLVMTPVLVALGLWQLDRADAKAELEMRAEQAAVVPAGTLSAQALRDLPHLARVRIAGRFDAERIVLLDNRTYQGRAGYAVFALLEPLDGGAAFLVDLGWVAAPARREELPALELPREPVVLRATLLRERDRPPVFGEVIDAGSWPLRVQRIDAERLAEHFGTPIHGPLLVAERGEAGVQTHVFEPVRMSSATHRGYALQWLGLAFVLATGWLLASLRRARRGVIEADSHGISTTEST